MQALAWCSGGIQARGCTLPELWDRLRYQFAARFLLFNANLWHNPHSHVLRRHILIDSKVPVSTCTFSATREAPRGRDHPFSELRFRSQDDQVFATQFLDVDHVSPGERMPRTHDSHQPVVHEQLRAEILVSGLTGHKRNVEFVCFNTETTAS